MGLDPYVPRLVIDTGRYIPSGPVRVVDYPDLYPDRSRKVVTVADFGDGPAGAPERRPTTTPVDPPVDPPTATPKPTTAATVTITTSATHVSGPEGSPSTAPTA